MAAHVLVLDTPFRAVSQANGSWLIPDVPDGEYVLRVWQPLAEEQQRSLKLVGGRAWSVPITVRETKPRVQHTNKNGRAYPAKY
jgi:hypothetical protein